MRNTPGIYFETADLDPQPASVRTDIAGFVGFAERGPVDQPVAVDSYTQFETIFGPPRSDLHLGWCLRGFFECGGARAWVCRAASASARAAERVVTAGGVPAFAFASSSSGVWGDALSITLTEATSVETLATAPAEEGRAVAVAETTDFLPRDIVRLSQPGHPPVIRVLNGVNHARGQLIWAAADRRQALPSDAVVQNLDPTLPLLITRLRYDVTVTQRGEIIDTARDLGLMPGGPNALTEVLAGLPRAIVVTDLRAVPEALPQALDLSTGPLALVAGRDGLTDVKPADLLRAIDRFADTPEPAIFLMPDLHEPGPPPVYVTPEAPEYDPCLGCPPAPEPLAVTLRTPVETPPGFSEDQIANAQHATLAWCAARPNAFAVLDMPRRLATGLAEGQRLLAWRRRFDSAFGALYHPWLLVPRQGNGPRLTPAAGHVAGQMAARDLAQGTHHAPANLRLSWVQAPSLDVSANLHGQLNDAGLNVLRTKTGRGLRVMGARTLSRDAAWVFVPVRRLMSMIGHALDLMSRWAVFEPNTHDTRAKLAALYAAYLTALWRRGALAGTDPSEAFFIRQAPPEAEALRGELTTVIGVAVLKPLEFIIFRIGRQEGAITVETSAAGRLQGAA